MSAKKNVRTALIEQSPTNKFHLTEKQMGELYLHLENKTFMGASLEMKMDKWYAKNSLVPTAQRIAAMVRLNPERFGVPPEAMVKVDYAIKERNLRTTVRETKEEKDLASENQNFKNILEDTRAGLLEILAKKVSRIRRSTKKIDEMNLGTLATALAIIIDKTQLIRGEATENVAVLAKIDQNISPEAALEMILKMRETNLESKNTKK